MVDLPCPHRHTPCSRHLLVQVIGCGLLTLGAVSMAALRRYPSWARGASRRANVAVLATGAAWMGACCGGGSENMVDEMERLREKGKERRRATASRSQPSQDTI